MSRLIAAGVGAATAPDPRRNAMALRAFLCQNVAIGSAFGSFGVIVLTFQQQFGVGRGLATLGIALAVLAMGVGSPIAARMIGRIGLRATMMTGVVLSGGGNLMLAFAPNFAVVLLAYALPIGFGLAMFGPFPASVLAARWFQPKPGPAIGFVNMPVLIALVPLMVTPLLTRFGLTGLFVTLAAMHVLLLPFVWGIIDAPDGMVLPAPAARAGAAAGRVLTRPLFWFIATGSGVLHASGIAASSHIVALGIESGLASQPAALLLSVMGTASIAGAFGAGLLCARIGAPATLALIAATTALGWLGLLSVHGLIAMALLTAVLGAGGAGVFPSINVLVGERFGLTAAVRTVGLLGLVTLPFNFGLPPLAGVLHDRTGGYGAVALAIALGCGAITLLFLIMARLPATTAPTAPA
ncbi:MFS transporter [Novosphingobium sp.]|uniref:MFS transporter n=1 Tax=Novosphingobium sp. TaxID=1874826 RepID=UPI003341767D